MEFHVGYLQLRASRNPQRTRHTGRLLGTLALLVAASIAAPKADATIIKSPPWADFFSAKYPTANGLDTRASGNSARSWTAATGYTATNSVTGTAPTSMNTYHAQADAVWGFFGHGGEGGGWIQMYNMNTATDSILRSTRDFGSCSAPDDCITDYVGGPISRMKLMLFAGCYTGMDGKPGMSYQGSLLRSASDGAGVDVAVGFNTTVDWPAMDTWTDWFFGRLNNGYTTVDALQAAKNRVYAVYGSYRGTDMWVARLNTNVKISPAGYGS